MQPIPSIIPSQWFIENLNTAKVHENWFSRKSVSALFQFSCSSLSVSPLSFTGSPLQFFVDYMNSGNVSAYGPGLIHGTVNKPAVFTVNTKDAGEGM